MTRPTIAVYTPVLNEAKHVERWYESAKQADLLLMLDTGSEDATVEVAKACGIEISRARIEPFRFDDARNMAMYSIPRGIDICLQLDADEVLLDGWRDELDEVNPAHTRWSYWLTNDVNTWGRVRRTNCVRMGNGFRWEHPIHEVIKGDPPQAHLDNLFIQHQPDRGKSRAYVLDMLEYWSAEYPDDARTLFYLGREYQYKKNWKDARTTLWRYLHHPNATWGAERGEALMLIAKMDADPERWLWQSISEAPNRREPFVALAKLRIKDQEWDRARALLLEAAARTDNGVYTTHADCWGEPFQKLLARVERHQR